MIAGTVCRAAAVVFLLVAIALKIGGDGSSFHALAATAAMSLLAIAFDIARIAERKP